MHNMLNLDKHFNDYNYVEFTDILNTQLYILVGIRVACFYDLGMLIQFGKVCLVDNMRFFNALP